METLTIADLYQQARGALQSARALRLAIQPDLAAVCLALARVHRRDARDLRRLRNERLAALERDAPGIPWHVEVTLVDGRPHVLATTRELSTARNELWRAIKRSA